MRSNQISFLQAHLATTEWQYKAEQTRCRTNLSRQQEGNNEQVPKIDDLEKQWAPNEGHWSFFTCKYWKKGTSGIKWKHVCAWIVVASAAPSRNPQNSPRLEMPSILPCAIVPNEKSSPFRPLRNNLNCTPCWLKIYDVISIRDPPIMPSFRKWDWNPTKALSIGREQDSFSHPTRYYHLRWSLTHLESHCRKGFGLGDEVCVTRNLTSLSHINKVHVMHDSSACDTNTPQAHGQKTKYERRGDVGDW